MPKDHSNENGIAMRRHGNVRSASITPVVDSITLKRTLGLFNGVALIIGIIVGSGIFISPKQVLLDTGSIGGALLVWMVTGVVCLIGALCLAELGSLISAEGGVYSYIRAGFGDFASFQYLWMSLLVTYPAGNAIIALTCSEYLLQPIFSCEGHVPKKAVLITSTMMLALLTLVNCMSVRIASRIQDIFTVIKNLALIIIIIAGLVVVAQGKVQFSMSEVFDHTETDPKKIAFAFYSGLFAYSGWYTVNFLTEELKKPEKHLALSIWISMPATMLIYTLTNIAYFAVLGREGVLQSDTTAFTLAERLFGIMSWVMPLLVACSCFGSLNGFLLSVSRLFYMGARNGHLPQFLALINTQRFTPLPAVVFQGLLSFCMLLVGDITLLLNCAMFVEVISYLFCIITFFIFRRKYNSKPRYIKVNLVFPIIFLLATLFLVLFPLFTSPWDIAASLFFAAAGVPVYAVGVAWRNKPQAYVKFMEHLTIRIQKCTMGAFPDEKDIQ